MSESEEAFESADEDIEDQKDKNKRRSRTTSEKLGEIKEVEPANVAQTKTDGDAASKSVPKPRENSGETASPGRSPKSSTSDDNSSKESEKSKADETGKEKELSVLERLAHAASREDKGPINWGFSKWGSSILSTAATSVSTFTNQVSQGIGTVIETVESTLGAPSPEELAQHDAEKQKTEPNADDATDASHSTAPEPDPEKPAQCDDKAENSGVGGILSGVSAFTKAIEATGSKVLSGGLDTLEMIGKKTMDILTENDPGLRKKRSMFDGKASLSEMLREAKEKAEKEAQGQESEKARDSVNYSRLFDEHQGLVHLEALEMLCSERRTAVQQQLQNTAEDDKAELAALLDKLKRTCESLPAADDTPDDEVDQDFEKLVTGHLIEIGLNLRGEKLKETDADVRLWLRECAESQEKGEKKDPKEIYPKSIETLAEMTAKTIELYHKVAELLLVKPLSDRTPMHFATQLTGLTAVLCTEVGILSSRFGRCLNTAADDSEDPDSVTPLITNVYLEASNSNTYIQDGFQLMVPILQSLALQQKDG